MTRRNYWALALLLPLLGGCLKTKETLRIDASGAIRVEVSVEGDPTDLADGHPIALSGVWRPRGENSRRWCAEIGPATGGEEIAARVGQSEWLGQLARDDRSLVLQAEASFPSIAALPEVWAPAGTPYRAQHLRRSNELTIEALGERKLYRFRRRFDRRVAGSQRIWSRAHESMKELVDRLGKEPLGEAERRRIAVTLERVVDELGAHQLAEALASIYLRGEGELGLARRAAILDSGRGALRTLVARKPLLEGVSLLDSGASDAATRFFESFEVDLRATLRKTLREGLEASSLKPALRHAVAGRLEEIFVRDDRNDDLEDESFELRIEMPGTVISGNYHHREGKLVVWKFDGKELFDRSLVCEVNSVVE